VSSLNRTVILRVFILLKKETLPGVKINQECKDYVINFDFTFRIFTVVAFDSRKLLKLPESEYCLYKATDRLHIMLIILFFGSLTSILVLRFVFIDGASDYTPDL